MKTCTSRPLRQPLTMLILTSCLLLALLLPTMATWAADEPVPPTGSLAADVLDHLLSSTEYRNFNAMCLEICRVDPAWAGSSLGLDVEKELRMLRDDARATKAVQTGYSTALQYSVGGVIVNNEGVRTSDLDTSMEYREAIVDAVTKNILAGNDFIVLRSKLVREYPRITGNIPPLDPDTQREFDKGIAAAKEHDWSGSITHFKAARQDQPYAPQIMFNLGIAESNLSGRELYAVAWFKAYLLAVPKAANADAVRSQVARLESGFVTKMRKIVDGLQGVLDSRESEPIEREYQPETAEAMRNVQRWSEWDLAAARYFLGAVAQARERVQRLYGEGWLEKARQDLAPMHDKATHAFLSSIGSGELFREPPPPDPVEFLATWATEIPNAGTDLEATFANREIYKPEFSGTAVMGLDSSLSITRDVVWEYARLHGISQ